MSEKTTNEERTILEHFQEDVAEEAAPILQFVTDNIKTIAAGLAAVVAVTAGSGVYTYTQQKALANAQSELGNIIVNKPAAEKPALLEAFAAKAPESVRVNALFELAKVYVETKQPEKAIPVWESIASKASGEMALVASFGKAEALVAQRKFPEALNVLDDIERKATDGLKLNMQLQLATVAEQAGDYTRALSTYEALNAAGALKKDQYNYKVETLRAKLAG